MLIMLCEFEYLLITAAASRGENAYGAAIREEISVTTGRKCPIGALYTTIDRLEIKGLLKTWMGEATPQRAGRAKRMVRVTALPDGGTPLALTPEFYEDENKVKQWNAFCNKNKPRVQENDFKTLGGCLISFLTPVTRSAHGGQKRSGRWTPAHGWQTSSGSY